nr:MAG TPA: hypothetical protein [Caudoviricetes sp.]
MFHFVLFREYKDNEKKLFLFLFLVLLVLLLLLQGIRTKKTQRKYKEKTNEYSSPLRAMSYLCLDN